MKTRPLCRTHSERSRRTLAGRLRRTLVASVGASALLGAAAHAAPVVYGESAMVKVHPNTRTHAAAPVDVYGARNEFVSFQVVVNGGPSGATHVRASFPGVTGKGGTIAGNDLTLYRESFLNITRTSTPDVSPGLWPDGLVPDVDEIAHEPRAAFPFNVSANQSQAIWIDVQVPKDQAAGDYTGQVTVTADGGFSTTVPVTLHVLPATLPSTSSLSSAFLIFAGNVCRAHTGSDCTNLGERDTLLAEYQQLALDHRFSLSNAEYVTDWTSYDNRWGPFIEGHASTRLPGAKVTTYQFTGPRDATHIKDWADHMRGKGWLDRAFDYTGDEPPYGITYSEILSRAAVVRKSAPDLRTLVTTSLQNANQNGITSSIDIMVPIINQLDGVGAPYDGDQRPLYDSFLQNPVKKLWVYQSCVSHGCAYGTNVPGNTNGAGWPSYMVDASSARNRAMQWTAFLEKASGELYYETANLLPTAWTNQYAFGGNGDGTLFYPGTPAKIGGHTDVPVPSIRLKYLRMGMQDYEWLKLVSDAGDPAFARKVAKTLIPKSSAVSDDGLAFESARRQLEQHYVELTQNSTGGVQPPPTGSNPSPPTSPESGSGGSSGSDGSSGVSNPKGGCSTTGAGGMLPLVAVLGAFALYGGDKRKRALAKSNLTPRPPSP